LDVYGIDREGDQEQQISIVEDMIAREYKAMVIAPQDSKALVPVCKKAIDAGMIVVNIDNPFDKDTMAALGVDIPFVGSNNFKGAEKVGEYIKGKLGGTGNILIIEGIRGVKNADLRRDGFKKGLGSGVTILASESANWGTEEAFELVSTFLDEHSDVDAIMAANDMMALGAIQALETKNLAGKILIGAYDNVEDARNQIREGNMHATMEQHPELMGAYGVRQAADGIAGKQIAANTATPLDLITTENIETTEDVADLSKIQ